MKNLEDYLYYEEKNPDLKIYCGDCLEILPLLPKVDLVVTDPPYGIGEHGGKVRFGGQAIAKGFKSNKTYENLGWDSKRISSDYFEAMKSKSENQIIFGMNYYLDYLAPTKCCLIWHKKGTDGSDFADCELAWTSLNKATKYFKYDWVGFGYINNKKGQEKQHPTQKPVQVMRWAMSWCEGSVLDPFLGSGTTLVACKELNRNGIGIEISEKYCEIAKNRLKATTKSLF